MKRTRSLLVASALSLGAAEARGAVLLQAVPPQAGAEAPTPSTKLEELLARYNAKRSATFAAYKKAESEEERATILAGLPGEDWAPEFRAIAKEAAGTDTAVQAWIWVLRLTDSDPAQAWEVVDFLLTDAIQSPALDELTGELRYASYEHGEAKVIEALTAIGHESPHDKVRARALFTLGAVRFDSSDPETKAGSRACFETLMARYGALPYRGSSTFKTASERYLYEMDHLQLGMVAPDFEAVDENGVAWKLSDYRGKVVVVDFWGFW